MKETLSKIVADDQAITAVLDGPGGFRLERLADLYRTSGDRDAFVLTLATKAMLEHDLRMIGMQRV